MIEQILSPEMVDALGWTLVHALWQGALFAILLGILLIALRRFSAQSRYVVSVGLLATFFLTVGFTFYNQFSLGTAEELALSSSNGLEEPALASSNSMRELPSPAPETSAYTEGQVPGPEYTASNLLSPPPSFWQRTQDYFNRHLPLIVTLWLLGVLMLQLRFLGQLAYVQRLKSYGVERFPSQWAGQIQELEEALRISKPVRYLTSRRVSSPLTVGWLRPAVLFPAGLLEQLKESQAATILAHELAHIKRNDFLVNLLQSFLTTFFFFHPGIWWMSARIEDEREHACDDLAVKATGGRIDYAKTLLQLKENQMAAPQLSVALAGRRGGFSYRIRRLLSGYLGSATYGEGIVTCLIFVATLGLAVTLTGQNFSVDGNQGSSQNMESAIAGDRESVNLLPAEVPNQTGETNQAGEATIDFDVFVDIDLGDFEFPAGTELENLSEAEELRLLIKAIWQGDMEMFRYFLARVDNLNQAGDAEEHNFSPLMAAASEDETMMLQELLDRGADVNFINPDGWTALMEAADEGSYTSAEMLLAAGADPNLRGPNTYATALRMAASEGFPQILELLLSQGADPQAGYPLHAAAEEGQLNVVRKLVEKDYPLDLRDDHGWTALDYAMDERQMAVVEYLRGYRAEHGSGYGDSGLSLQDAADEGELEIVERLLADGAEVNSRDRHGRTALHAAAEDGHSQVTLVLLHAGAEIDARSLRGETALFLAAEDDQQTVAEILIEAGADVNARDQRGNTPLMAAADDDHPRLIRLLLDAGADATLRNRQGQDAYGLAASEGSLAALTALTDPLQEQALDNLLNSPEILIGPAGEGHLFLVRQMLETGIDINITDERGRTALSEAAKEGHASIVDYLLSQGAEMTGGTCGPVYEAVREGHVHVLDKLLNYGARLDGRCSFRAINFRNDYGAAYAVSVFEGASLLIKAVEEENLPMVDRLLTSGADPNEGCTKRRFKTEGQEIDWGEANLMSIDQLREQCRVDYEANNWTPLMEAAEIGSFGMVSRLLAAGADPAPAREVANRTGNASLIRLLNR